MENAVVTADFRIAGCDDQEELEVRVRALLTELAAMHPELDFTIVQDF